MRRDQPTRRFHISSTVFCWFAIGTAALAQENPPAEMGQPTVTNIYKNDFSERIEINQWTCSDTPQTPSGRRILKLEPHTSFTQKKLPDHKFVRVRFKLVVLGSFDGSDAEFGPDRFAVVVDGGTTLMRTTFGNFPEAWNDPLPRLSQGYPDDEIAGALHPSTTGASVNKQAHGHRLASEYDINLVFPHSADELKLIFTSFNRSTDDVEEYALSSIEVDVVSAAMSYSEAEFAAMWTALVGQNPVKANEALTKFVGAGKSGADYVRKKLHGDAGAENAKKKEQMKVLEAKIQGLMGDIVSDEFQKRVVARAALKKLPEEAIPLLEKEKKASSSPVVQTALGAVIKSLKSKLANSDEGAHAKRATSRTDKILRIWRIAESGRVTTTSSGWKPKDCLDDGYAPTGKITGVEVPSFEFGNHGDERESEWVEYSYPEERTFDFADVYWAANKGWDKGVKLPKSWSITYLEGDEWKPVKLKPKNDYTVSFGKVSQVEFDPIRTKKIRLIVEEQEKQHAGLYEWRTGEREK